MSRKNSAARENLVDKPLEIPEAVPEHKKPVLNVLNATMLVLELKCMLTKADTSELKPRDRERIVEAKAELTRFSSKLLAIEESINDRG